MKCIIVDDDILSRKVLGKFVKELGNLTLEKECESATDAINYLEKNDVDLIFLDVEMPKMTGFQMINVLKKRPIIILVSSKKSYASEGFDYEVADFIPKPITIERFERAIFKAKKVKDLELKREEKVESPIVEDSILIRTEGTWVKINTLDISYIQAMADYINLYEESVVKTKRHVIHSTMKSFETRLDTSKFIRVHRSYIVNINKIKVFDSDTVSLPDNTQIPVGVTYKKELSKAMSLVTR